MQNQISQAVKSALEAQIKSTEAYKNFEKLGKTLSSYGSSAASWAGSQAQSMTNKILGSGSSGLGGWLNKIGGSDVGSMVTSALTDFVEDYFDKVFGTQFSMPSAPNIFEELNIPQVSGGYSNGWDFSASTSGLSSASIDVSYGGYSGSARINMDGSLDLSAGVNLTYNGGNAYGYGNVDTSGNYSVGAYAGGSGSLFGNDFNYGAGANYNKNDGFRAAVSFTLSL